MLNIYAHSFMTATRTGEIKVRDVPAKAGDKRTRWLGKPKVRFISPDKL